MFNFFKKDKPKATISTPEIMGLRLGASFEIDKLAKGHKHSVEHDCYNYESWFHYIDTTSNYHFDKTRDDTNHPGIDTSVKFRWKHDIKEEIEPFIREKSMNVHPNDIAILYKS